jgi:hypothetical protein
MPAHRVAPSAVSVALRNERLSSEPMHNPVSVRLAQANHLDEADTEPVRVHRVSQSVFDWGISAKALLVAHHHATWSCRKPADRPCHPSLAYSSFFPDMWCRAVISMSVMIVSPCDSPRRGVAQERKDPPWYGRSARRESPVALVDNDSGGGHNRP